MTSSKMTMPRISVLMAVYNGGAYLMPAVQSVLDQTFKDFELLIIDDRSTDGSGDLIGSIQDTRIRLHRNPQNMGQTKSLNEGFRLARGEWVARMDADDVALPHWLMCQSDYIKAHPDVAVVSANALVIDKEGGLKGRYLSPSNADDIILRSFFKSPINHVGSLINRKIALELGGYDEKYRTVADYDLWKKMIIGGHKLTSLTKTCVAIRRHEESFSFQDLGDDYFRQIAAITMPIIAGYSKAAFSHDELCTLLKALYTPQGMSKQEFESARSCLSQIFGNISIEKFSDPRRPRFWSRKFMRELLLKRIRVLIGRKEYRAVREVARIGLAECGALSAFLYFYGASFCGAVFLSFIPRLYFLIARIRAFAASPKIMHRSVR